MMGLFASGHTPDAAAPESSAYTMGLPFAKMAKTPAEALGSIAARRRLPARWRPAPRPHLAARFLTTGSLATGDPAATQEQLDRTAQQEEDSEQEQLARLEAALFIAREPIPSRKLAVYARLADGTAARTLIRRLNERYDRVQRAFRVEEIAGGFRLLTQARYAAWLRRLAHVPAEVRLSGPAQETLAVVAYRQPAPRAEIESIRGVSCGEVLRQLMERDLVRIGGRSEELGRPYLYCTTKRFLEIFGLKSLEQLPQPVGAFNQPGAAHGQDETTVAATDPSATPNELADDLTDDQSEEEPT